jgi:hypothetical protein
MIATVYAHRTLQLCQAVKATGRVYCRRVETSMGLHGRELV